MDIYCAHHQLAHWAQRKALSFLSEPLLQEEGLLLLHGSEDLLQEEGLPLLQGSEDLSVFDIGDSC